MRPGRWARPAAVALAAVLGWATPGQALDGFTFQTPGADKDLRSSLLGASLLVQSTDEKTPQGPQDLFAAARADYGRLLGALYAAGRYGGVIHILINGREASDIAALEVPSRIGSIKVTVDPGPLFTFRQARMRPYAPGTELPREYLDTAPAKSTAIVAAAGAGVDGWRALGHAKAGIENQKITADHRSRTVDSWIFLRPGPVVTFGSVTIEGHERMRPARLARIADFPTGKRFDPDELDAVIRRLHRTGVFKSVTLTEDETLGPGNTLGYHLALVEEKKRRMGAGAEWSTADGAALTAYWMHRNLFGGAERLKIDGEITGISGSTGGTDYALGVRLDRPATFSRDTTAFVEARIEHLDEADYSADKASIGLGLSQEFSPQLTVTAGLSYEAADVRYKGGKQHYQLIAVPTTLAWDRRDKPLDAARGFYLGATATPFLGFGSTGSGAQLTADGRVYRGFGVDDRVVLAARVQMGTVVGPTLLSTPRDYLFYTGGGGTVRGQPYQSLGVNVLRAGPARLRTGGMSFAAGSVEARVGVTAKIGAVAFADVGYVSAQEFFGGLDGWHAGAGAGIRYATPIGPIRLDVAAPVAGNTGDGMQIYLGIGQAF